MCEQEMAHAARAHAIPLSILYSVGLTETGARGRLNPYDMNVDGRALHFESLDAALQAYRLERSKGAKLIDVGCMQINVKWHADRFRSVEHMFDPRSNVEYAARFLKQLRERHGAWTLAVARYNAGPDNNSAQRKYVCAVIRHLVKAGMGAWTAEARVFCQTSEASGPPPRGPVAGDQRRAEARLAN